MNDTPTRKPGAPVGNKNALKGTDNLKRHTIRFTNSQWDDLKLASVELGITPNALLQRVANNIDNLKKAL